MRGYFVLAVIILITGSQAIGQRQMENLNRGVIAFVQDLILYILDGGCLELNQTRLHSTYTARTAMKSL